MKYENKTTDSRRDRQVDLLARLMAKATADELVQLNALVLQVYSGHPLTRAQFAALNR